MRSKIIKFFSLLLLSFSLVLLVGCEFTFNFGNTTTKKNTTTTTKATSSETKTVTPSTTTTTKAPTTVTEPKKEQKYYFYTIEDDVEDLSFLEGYPWINTSIEGVMGKIKRPDAKDDFFAYANYDSLKDYKIPSGKDKYGGVIFESGSITQERILNILNDSNSPLYLINNLITEGDLNTIKADLEASLAYTDEDIIDIFKSKEMFYCYINQLDVIDQDDAIYITYSTHSDDNIALSYYYADYEGQADEYANALNEILKAEGIELNNSLNIVKNTLDTLLNIFNSIFEEDGESYNGEVSGLDSVYTGFIDLKSGLKELGFSDTTKIKSDSCAYLYSKAFEKEIEDNGYDFLRYMIVLSKAYYYRYYIGAEAYLNLHNSKLKGIEGMENYSILDTSSVQDVVLSIVEDKFSELLSREYSLRYANNSTRAKVSSIIEDVISEYKLLLSENTWLTEETRNKAIEKLDSMTYIAYYQDGLLDTSNFETNSNDIVSVSKNYHDYVFTYYEHINIGILTGMAPYVTNAAYFASSNRFVITHSIVSSFIDEDNIKDEYIYGAIATVIGHEISHGFDSTGAQYDKDGKWSNWWSDEDKSEFKKRVDKIINYFDTKLFSFNGSNLDGDLVDGEVTADLGGMKVALRLVSKLDNPDYTVFFEAYARYFGFVYTHEKGFNDTLNNPHPLSYLRVNLTLAQFDIFQETYNIKEGDGMYITPEDRIVVW